MWVNKVQFQIRSIHVPFFLKCFIYPIEDFTAVLNEAPKASTLFQKHVELDKKLKRSILAVRVPGQVRGSRGRPHGGHRQGSSQRRHPDQPGGALAAHRKATGGLQPILDAAEGRPRAPPVRQDLRPEGERLRQDGSPIRRLINFFV